MVKWTTSDRRRMGLRGIQRRREVAIYGKRILRNPLLSKSLRYTDNSNKKRVYKTRFNSSSDTFVVGCRRSLSGSVLQGVLVTHCTDRGQCYQLLLNSNGPTRSVNRETRVRTHLRSRTRVRSPTPTVQFVEVVLSGSCT